MKWSEVHIKHTDLRFIFAPLTLLICILCAISLFRTDVALLAGGLLSTLWIVTVLLHVYRGTLGHLQHAQRQTQALITLHTFLPLRLPLPPLAGWAATPELAVHLLDTIERHGCRSIVELGSGSSTLVVGYVLEKRKNGHLLSLDHDPVYTEKTRQNVIAHGLDAFCSVVHAPLREQACGDLHVRWYDLENVSLPQQIDLLIIDGPPSGTQRHARYPALPMLARFFADRVFIVLDDAGRKSEVEILDRWRQEFPSFSIESLPTMKGLAILHRQAT